jgi:hypothetical protein
MERNKQNPKPITRRALLKALAASGGALAAAALLPGKWARPLVEAGVLPAHAQGSLCAEISLSEAPAACQDPAACQGFSAYIVLAYTPANLKVRSVSASSCSGAVSSGWTSRAAGSLTVFFNYEDLINCTYGDVEVSFTNGCKSAYRYQFTLN